MLNKISASIKSLWNIKKEFRLKVFFLTMTFLLMSGCLAIWRPLKVSIFSKIVGSEFVPNAKLLSLFYLIPLILLYSKLVDWLRRHQLLYCYTIFHGIGGIIFYFFLAHPVYGIANTSTDSSRILGWLFYFFMESFTAFLSTVFWSFADSINNHKDAKNFFGIFVAGSKIGSIITAGLLYLAITFLPNVQDQVLLPYSLLIGSFLLVGASVSIYLLKKIVPGYLLHGYEAVYQMEKEKEISIKKKEVTKGFWKSLISPLEGLFLIIKNPYVLGIFSLVLFYEIVIVIFDYQVLRKADATYSSAGSLTAYYALYYLMMNMVGLVIALFGTTPILRVLGIRVSLFIFPVASICILLTTLFFPSAAILFGALVALRALNYALNHPIREILYIPTTKSIKFKAKAWVDAFGSRLAKGGGSVFNLSLKGFTPVLAIFYSLSFSLSLVSAWLIVVYFLGKTLQNALSNKRVIGQKDKQ